MYVPDKFAVDDPTVRAWLREGGLADLVTTSPEGLTVTPIPFVYVQEGPGWGSLIGHMARVNPQWRCFGKEALVIVRGPSHYVTPDWRPTTRLHGKVVPTWDYNVAHVRGRLVVHDDAAWIEDQVRLLADHHEPQHGSGWNLDKAPRRYTDGQLRALVGIEVLIDSVTGKMKMGQDRPYPDQVQIAERLRGEGRPESAAAVETGLAIGEARRQARDERVAEVTQFRTGQEIR